MIQKEKPKGGGEPQGQAQPELQGGTRFPNLFYGEGPGLQPSPSKKKRPILVPFNQKKNRQDERGGATDLSTVPKLSRRVRERGNRILRKAVGEKKKVAV